MLKTWRLAPGNSNIVDMSSNLSICQRDIDNIFHVASSWILQLNAEKCCVMRFALKKSHIGRLDKYQFESYYVLGVGLPFVDSWKDLGILVDTELKFYGHIRFIVGEISGMSVNLLNLTFCRSRELMLTLYISHIRPLLEFGSCVWNLGYKYQT